MADWNSFSAKWAADLRPLRPEDAITEWRKFVEDSRTDEGILQEAVGEMAELAMIRKNTPNLRVPFMPNRCELMTAYFKLKQKACPPKFSDSNCPYCRGGGLAAAVAGQGGRFIRRISGPVFDLFACAVMAPCHCAAGKKFHEDKSREYGEQPRRAPYGWLECLFKGYNEAGPLGAYFISGWTEANEFAAECRALIERGIEPEAAKEAANW